MVLGFFLGLAQLLQERVDRMSDRQRSVACAVGLALVLAVAGAVEASAPGGMYY